MPYIICVSLPGCLPERHPTAVATLDQAREFVTSEFEDADAPWVRLTCTQRVPLEAALRPIPTPGRVIGLPDGYVVDVQQVSWTELATLAGYNTMTPRDDIAVLARDGYAGDPNFADDLIDAYNDWTDW